MVICLKWLLDCLLICTYSSAHFLTQQRKYPHYFLWSPLYSRKLWIQTLRSWIVKGNSKLNPSVSIIFCLSAFLENGQDYLSVLIFMQGADHLTLEAGRGRVILKKKIFCKRLSGEKNCMQQKCNRKLMGKKGKKYPAHQIARKKNSWWAEINHPLPLPLKS